MNRLPVFWNPAPDPEDSEDFERYIAFRVTADWVSVDDDQLILPVAVTERDGNGFDEGEQGILKQYGGHGLLNDMLLADQDLEAGSEWMLSHQEGIGRTIEALDGTD